MQPTLPRPTEGKIALENTKMSISYWEMEDLGTKLLLFLDFIRGKSNRNKKLHQTGLVQASNALFLLVLFLLCLFSEMGPEGLNFFILLPQSFEGWDDQYEPSTSDINCEKLEIPRLVFQRHFLLRCKPFQLVLCSDAKLT